MVQRTFAVIFGFLLVTALFARTNAVAVVSQQEQGMQQEQGLKPGQTGQVGEQNEKSAQYDPFFGMLHKLNLTETQKADVADVLKSHEAQAKDLANKVSQAGIEVRKDFINGRFNQEHFANWVKFEQEGAQLRANIMASILPKLNQQQQATLRDMQQQIGQNLQSDINARFARLDNWIAQHSKSRS